MNQNVKTDSVKTYIFELQSLSSILAHGETMIIQVARKVSEVVVGTNISNICAGIVPVGFHAIGPIIAKFSHFFLVAG